MEDLWRAALGRRPVQAASKGEVRPANEKDGAQAVHKSWAGGARTGREVHGVKGRKGTDGVTLQPGTRAMMKSAATVALGLPTSDSLRVVRAKACQGGRGQHTRARARAGR